MIYNRFDVCFAKVQFEDKGVSRDRPVIVMQDMGDYAICLKCTTNLNTPVHHQHIQMLPEAGLHQETTIVLKSYIKLFKNQIRVKTGHLDIYDIASLQARLDEYKNEMKLQEKLHLNESLFEEYNESDNNLTEAKKKRKKKKISQVNPGEAIFKSVKDLQKWVKKRQKGWGSFVHIDNCGNMDYNNDMFNKMNGADNSSSSGSDISTDVGGGASEGVSTGAGMGESLKLNELREPKPDRSFIETTPFKNLILAMKEVGEFEGKSNLVSPVADKIIATLDNQQQQEKPIPYKEYAKHQVSKKPAIVSSPQLTSPILPSTKNPIVEGINEGEKLSPNLIQFMKEHRDLINEEDWDTLFLDYAEDELSEEDQSQLVQALISIGCDIEVIE